MMPTVSEKLLQVAQNNPKVYHSGQLNIVKNAECLKEFKSDTSLLLDNVSPVKHNMGVKVHGKNLFNLSNWVSDYMVTHEVLDNGQILITGASETTKSGYTQFKQFLNAGTYTVSATMTANSTGTKQMVLVWQVKDDQIIKTLYNPDGTTGLQRTVTITLTESKYYYFGLYGGTDNDESVYVTIQIELGTTATAYTPYVPDLTAVKVTRRGKNLFSGLTKGIGIHSTNGSEITNSNYAASDYIPVDFNTNTNYYISGLPTTISNFVAAYNANKEFLGRTGGSVNSNYKMASAASFQSGTPQGTGDISYLRVCCYKTSVNTGTINDIDGCNIQLEVGSSATEYEPYNSATFTPTADGTVNGVTSLYPNTTLMTDTDGVVIDCEYYKDVDKAFDELTTSVALSGGDS